MSIYEENDLTVLERRTGVDFGIFSEEAQLHEIYTLITADLSEPYSIYTYRYFVYNWPQLCILAYNRPGKSAEREIVGVIVSKIDRMNTKKTLRGYIAMLAVRPDFRKRKIATLLIQRAIQTMEVCISVAVGAF